MREPVCDMRELSRAYREHWDYVLLILGRYGVPDAMREDAAQEVFIVAHRRWADLEHGASVRAWLYGIARRVASTQRRGARRRTHRMLRVPSPEPALGLDEAVERERAQRALTRAIEGLEGDKRRVFEMASEDGRSGPEIAESLGVGINTVYSRLRLARAQVVSDARRLCAAC